MKRVVLWVCALMMTLVASVCVAGTYSPYFTTEPPREVREHVANRWPDYEFEDYCEVRGTPKGDYGFALVHRKNERILVGYHKVDGEILAQECGRCAAGKRRSVVWRWHGGLGGRNGLGREFHGQTGLRRRPVFFCDPTG